MNIKNLLFILLVIVIISSCNNDFQVQNTESDIFANLASVKGIEEYALAEADKVENFALQAITPTHAPPAGLRNILTDNSVITSSPVMVYAGNVLETKHAHDGSALAFIENDIIRLWASKKPSDTSSPYILAEFPVPTEIFGVGLEWYQDYYASQYEIWYTTEIGGSWNYLGPFDKTNVLEVDYENDYIFTTAAQGLQVVKIGVLFMGNLNKSAVALREFKVYGARNSSAKDVDFVGLRSTDYGVMRTDADYAHNFPTTQEWAAGLTELETHINPTSNSEKIQLWNVGTPFTDVWPNPTKIGVELEMPHKAGADPDYIRFKGTSHHNQYLANLSDSVYMQVELGQADLDTVIGLLDSEWGKDPYKNKVVGLAVDVEFYKTADLSGGSKESITATDIKNILGYMDSSTLFNGKKLLLKHFFTESIDVDFGGIVRDVKNLPTVEELVKANVQLDRLVMCCDFQDGGSYANWLGNLISFADAFDTPSGSVNVVYQIGYPADLDLWQISPYNPMPYFPWIKTEISSNFDVIIPTLANALRANTSNNQEVGIIWVDFTMRDALDAFTNVPKADLVVNGDFAMGSCGNWSEPGVYGDNGVLSITGDDYWAGFGQPLLSWGAGTYKATFNYTSSQITEANIVVMHGETKLHDVVFFLSGGTATATFTLASSQQYNGSFEIGITGSASKFTATLDNLKIVKQ